MIKKFKGCRLSLLSIRWLNLLGLLLLFFSFSSLVAVPQLEAAEKSTIEDNTLEVLIVTAERRETDLQKTPIAITAFTAEDLEQSNITKIPDLVMYTPGLTIGNTGNSSFPEIYLRGVGTRDPSVASDLSVGFYVDDVYIGRGISMLVDLFDLERIEVLKGPQGTLWGRNTVGGAIHIITKKPTDDFSSSHKLKIGNFGLFRISGNAGGSLIDNTLLGKISYSYEDRDGYVENVFRQNSLADAESFSVRGDIQFLANDNIEFLISVDATKERPSSAAFDPIISGAPVLSGLAGNITVADPPFNHIEPDGPYQVSHDSDSREHRDIYGISGKLSWRLDDLTFYSLSSARSLKFDNIENTAGLSLQLVEFFQNTEQWQFSQEFRLANDLDERIQWLVGAFFFHEDTDDMLAVEAQDFNLLLAPLFGTQDYSSTNFSSSISNSYSLFGQLKYELTEHLSTTVGLRYTYEDKAFRIRRVSNDFNQIMFDPSFPLTRFDDNWEAFSPKIGVEYEYSDNLFYYASISRGFRSGGYNSLQFQLQDSFDPEFLTSYELGVKSKWLDQRLQLNLSAFYYDHTDQQVQTIITSGTGTAQVVTTNAAESRDIGLELEVLALPLTGLQLNGGFSYLHAKYEAFINAEDIDVSGNTINHSPEFSSNLGVQYTFPVNGDGSITIRGEHQYRSKIYFTETNETILSQGGYHNINARLEYKTSDDKYTIAAFGRNLTDEAIAHTGVDLRAVLGTVSNVYNPPRTYGVELTVNF